MQHVQGRDLKPRVVVDAENVRRSTWPNLSKEELVARARAWAAREDADLLVVFDGDPPEVAPDLLGSGRRSADDVIASWTGLSGDVRPRSPRARRKGRRSWRRLFLRELEEAKR